LFRIQPYRSINNRGSHFISNQFLLLKSSSKPPPVQTLLEPPHYLSLFPTPAASPPPLPPPPMASSAAAAPPSRHSVFDASYIRSEFAAAGISAHFIPLIWKYGSMSPPLESSSHDALTPSCFLCHYSCLILRNFLIQYRSECWFSACTGTCFITLGAGTWTASHRCRRPRMRSSGRSSGRPHRP
jgi:hypothetical protein